MSWQPIETAPKDGTHILGWQDDVAVTIHWEAFPAGEGVWRDSLNDEYQIFATHWRELEPPA